MVMSAAYCALIDLLKYGTAVLLLGFCSRSLYDITSSQLNSFHTSHQCSCEELSWSPQNEITWRAAHCRTTSTCHQSYHIVLHCNQGTYVPCWTWQANKHFIAFSTAPTSNMLTLLCSTRSFMPEIVTARFCWSIAQEVVYNLYASPIYTHFTSPICRYTGPCPPSLLS